MREVHAPAAGGPVRRAWAARAALLWLLLGAAGCRAVEVPTRSAQAAEPGERIAAPARANGALDAACQLAEQTVDAALGVEAERSDDPLSDLLAEPEQAGCRFTAIGSFADLPEDVETPIDVLWDSFDRGGWYEDPRFASDTEETSALGMWKGGVLCVMGAAWAAPVEYDAGYNEAYEPTEEELRYDLTVECAPAEAPPIPLTGSMALKC